MKPPLTTPAQKRIEDRAMALLERPEMQRAKAATELLWRNAVAWPARSQADRFDNMIEEYLFHHAMRAANGDPHHPEVACFMTPERHWAGRRVPGSRWAGDSPDFIYRTIPIAHGGRYLIEGKATCAEAPTVNYSLMGDNTAQPVTLTLLDSLDMEIGADGSFEITVDDTPADGRPNHIQTKPGADFIMVRDALGDWETQGPNTLTVRRLDPTADPLDDEALVRKCARIALDGLYYTYYCTQSGQGQPPNEVRAPMSAGAFGGMATQYGAKGLLRLGPDQALIARSNGAGAGFRNLMLTDAFHMSIDYWKRTSSLNMVQLAPDEDADDMFTCVVSAQDPGVHNWLDTAGLAPVNFGQRWQAFARDGSAGTPTMEARLVRFDDLERELSDGVKRIGPAERAAQIDCRRKGYARRWTED